MKIELTPEEHLALTALLRSGPTKGMLYALGLANLVVRLTEPYRPHVAGAQLHGMAHLLPSLVNDFYEVRGKCLHAESEGEVWPGLLNGRKLEEDEA